MGNKQKNKHTIQFETDGLLWQSLRLGNPDALSSLFKEYYSDLYFYGMKLKGDHGQVVDTIQDIFANIWESRRSISKVTYVKAYLFTTLRNNLLKSNPRDILSKPEFANNQDKDIIFDISPEELYIDKETHLENVRIVEKMLDGLSPKQKEIIYLKFYSNYSNIEISKILSIKQQSVANLLNRTLILLRKMKKYNDSLFLSMLIYNLL